MFTDNFVAGAAHPDRLASMDRETKAAAAFFALVKET
jgi:hypothetical protein